MVLRWDVRSRSIRTGRARQSRERRTASACASAAIIAGTGCMRAAPRSPACTIRWSAVRPTCSAVKPAKEPATIVVLGGGPAGMEAARARGRARPSRCPVREGASAWRQGRHGREHSAAMREYANVAALSRTRGARAPTISCCALARPHRPRPLPRWRPRLSSSQPARRPLRLRVAGDGSIPVVAGFETVRPRSPESTCCCSDEDGYWWAAQAAEEVVNRGATADFCDAFLRAVPGVAHGVTDRCPASARRAGRDHAGAASAQSVSSRTRHCPALCQRARDSHRERRRHYRYWPAAAE